MLPGVIGTFQALEAIKLVLGAGDPLVGRLVLFDSLGMKFREVRLRRDPRCALCGDHPTITSLDQAGAAGTGASACPVPAQTAG